MEKININEGKAIQSWDLIDLIKRAEFKESL
jgi:hypothetical protein